MERNDPPPAHDLLGFKVPTPTAAAPRRPGLLTAAAVLLFVFGGVGLIAGAWILAGTQGAGVSFLHDGTPIHGAFPLLIGCLYLAAGVLILRLRPAGQVLGFVSAGIMTASSIARLGTAPGTGITGLAVAGFLIYAVAAHAPLLRTSGRR